MLKAPEPPATPNSQRPRAKPRLDLAINGSLSLFSVVIWFNNVYQIYMLVS